MRTSIHDYVLARLGALKRPDWRVVAAGSGVPFRTVEKIARREIKFSRIDTIEKLAAWFQREESKQERRRTGS